MKNRPQNKRNRLVDVMAKMPTFVVCQTVELSFALVRNFSTNSKITCNCLNSDCLNSFIFFFWNKRIVKFITRHNLIDKEIQLELQLRFEKAKFVEYLTAICVS